MRGGTLAWAALIVTLAIPLNWGAAPQFPWDIDNIAPGSVLRAIAQHFHPGWYSSYGPVPYLITALLYVPLLAVMRVSGELSRGSTSYPWGFAHPERSIELLVVAARLVTAAFALALVALAARRDRNSLAPAPAWAPPLLALGSPLFCYYARTSNVDLHYLFWLWLGFALLERPGDSRRTLALASVAGALAVCCKEQSAPIALVVIGTAVARAWSAGGPGPTRALRDAALVALAAAASYALAWGLPFNLEGWRWHHHFIFSQARYPRSFPLTPAGLAALLSASLHQLPVVLGPLGCAAMAAALLMRSSWRGLGARALGCTLYLGTFLTTIGYVYPRFLMPLLLLALPLGARGLADLARLTGRGRARVAVPAVALALALFGGPALSLAMLTDSRLAAERWMRDRVPAGARIEIAGNPHYQARVPAERAVLYTRADSLAVAPHGPRGDVVLTSSIDSHTFRLDPILKREFWDSLAAPPPAGAYRLQVFHSGPAARFVRGLPVSPEVRIYVRCDLALR